MHAPENPNLRRRPGPGLWVRPLSFLLLPWLIFFRHRRKKNRPLAVFQSYQVGDLFMALPALKALAAEVGIRVICRPDCAALLHAEGLDPIPFENAFFVRGGIFSFLRTWRAAWNIRPALAGTMALDFDADPRTALWLRIAGVRRVISYQRPFASLFHVLFPLALPSSHQADKNMAVARGFLERRKELAKRIGLAPTSDPALVATPVRPPIDPGAPWILSCWTRMPEKNWPLERWSELLEKMVAAHLPLLILDPPDASPEFHRFKQRWANRVAFLSGPLEYVAGYVRTSAGVLAVDNFIGHMAAFYGKPVLWINGSSDPAHVMPQGPKISRIQTDPMPCRPCGHRCVNPDRFACLSGLSVNGVWKAFEELRGNS